MFEKLKQLVTKTEQTATSNGRAAGNTPALAMSAREEMVYGGAHINRQKLYEKWVSKESWLLRTEGIMLLQGLDPENTVGSDAETAARLEELWQHASDCVGKKLLSVVNPDMPEEQWQVVPADLYCWATVSRVSVPHELASLMEFVLQTVKVKPVNKQDDNNASVHSDQDERYLRDREITLGAAVSLLVNSPDACKSRRGQFKARLIAAEIMKHSDVWFGKEGPVLAQTAMEDLINRYIAESQVLVNLSGD